MRSNARFGVADYINDNMQCWLDVVRLGLINSRTGEDRLRGKILPVSGGKSLAALHWKL
jgi:hypothetical protein